MDILTKEILEVHEILSLYIKIHDDIFKKSLRRIIPIPGIFKAINYDQYRDTLFNLSKKLKKVIINKHVNENNRLEVVLKEYEQALLNTIVMLHDICGKLYIKSKGNLSSYSKAQYNSDLNKYNSLMAKYKTIGDLLNQLMQKLNL